MTTLKAPNGIVATMTAPVGWTDVIQLYKGDDKVAHIFIYSEAGEQVARVLHDGYRSEWNLRNARNWFKSMVELGYKWEKISRASL
jgi:hypothetical protein